MAFVGFLTFGFTQAVCPRPALSYRIDDLNNGYVVINGWAYLLASWNDHPPIPGLTEDNTNPTYPPIDAGGKDASFLFQTINKACASVITSASNLPVGQDSSLPTYFPCRLFNTHTLDVPDPSTYGNATGCHTSSLARSSFQAMKTYGVPKPNGGFDKAGRVYYDWKHVNSSSYLAVYNSNVLNLNLLHALPQQLIRLPPNGLFASILNNPAVYGGQDITHIVASRRIDGSTWKQEAKCLTEIIKVGEIDTKSVGCIASDVVLYTSLLVILGVILVKFGLAVLFGWCLSWKLGNFKEGRSYKERMKRELEIENWTSGIHRPAEAIQPHEKVLPYPVRHRRSLMPKTSRFTLPEAGSMHFNALERPSNVIWKQSPEVRVLSSYNSSVALASGMTPLAEPSSLRPLGSDNGRSYSSRRQSGTSPDSGRSSMTSTSGVSHGSLQHSCPYPVSAHAIPPPKSDYMPFGFSLVHTICLVTCYSEGIDGLRTTLDSIATTDYPNSHKLIMVIADGIITGHGNSMSTPDICLSMMHDFLIPPEQVQPYSYVAIADGAHRHNMAKIYSGFYRYDDATVDPSQQQRVPMIIISKTGAPEEAKESKPGNRGKRDSQVILMSFLQKVMFDERMTMLDYELFTNIWRITGNSPDKYEIVLMVDADTKVYPDALSRLVSCMVNDPEISGLCGETKIGNKTDSWVSMIQVFEYYISHHQSKAFESIFGNVTCLPGCFCMYRIKAPKGNNGHWVPILANPDIIERYSENVVDTLHKKNLLLLGEDRYLSTLMLKTFPRRKMIFVPQAVCKTVVPDSFSVLLSQRRRWINSTIHNLMELLFVHDLCGTFCFSMQFVVFMELVGTLALPAAISFTLYLIILALMGQPAVLSLILLALILGLPAVLIVMTSRKLVYIGWMLIYLFSLPIWNFVLPTYAYWHFDDFTWGETRKVQGADKSHHGDREGEFDSSKIVMKKWSEYERDRKLRMVQQKNMDLNSSLPFRPLSYRQYPSVTDLSQDLDRPASIATPIASRMLAARRQNSELSSSHTNSSPSSTSITSRLQQRMDAFSSDTVLSTAASKEFSDPGHGHSQDPNHDTPGALSDWRRSLEFLNRHDTVDLNVGFPLPASSTKNN
ncbi:chitin synthase-domain-containing protein [Radiomyces spectabilis]|uniref:chitin synthase-domain-containing protein n=1 Tax=Radiomyces spectabilis TaxID=64574 RepID=UPI002220EC42|nr:chitin synthase-domain-containing protein [Radiomyces spectabilis]KAI8368208.1 chitin synthase-domain-containing protein [Radiomyces spectabilis]